MVLELTETDAAPISLASPRPTTVRRPWQSIVEPLRIFVVSRVVVLACALTAVIFIDPNPEAGPWPREGGPSFAVLQALGRWDGAWYMDVARHGYRAVAYGHANHASEAFFPAYPAFVRTVSIFSGVPTLVAGLVVTTIFAAIATVLLARIVVDISGEDAARRAVTLFCFSPGAFVLSMAYSEALFVAATAASLLALTRRRWFLAGGCAAVATLARPNGVALVVACGVGAVIAIRQHRDMRALAAPLIGVTGVLAYFAFLFAKSGHVFEWFDVERSGWADRVSPVSGVVDHASRLGNVSLRAGGLNDLVWIASLVVTVGCVVALVRWRPPAPLFTYGVLAALLAASSYQVGARPRLLLDAFPLVLAAGAVLHGVWYRVVLVASIVGLVALSLVSFGTLATFP